VSPDKGWHPERIKAAIRMRGKSLSELSRQHGLNDHACHFALRKQWPRVEQVIADFLGVKPWVLWPDRYTSEQRPRGPRRERRDETNAET
jgi:Ner family transcriptional regulator